jgi:hypothetical protein
MENEGFQIVTPQSIHILPPFGAQGCCADYDSDCFDMSQENRIICYGMDAPSGQCPFLD